MKKFFVIMAVAVAMLTGCKNESEFNKYVASDYELVKAQYPEQEVVFYEAQITLNGSPVELGTKAKPVTVTEIYQLRDSAIVVFLNRDYTNGTYEIKTEEGFWCEDVVVDPVGLADFNDALKVLVSLKGVTVPDTPLVTFRNPLGPIEFENPFYIFGSNHTSFVAIDARTLEVQIFEAVESELRAEK